jgi:hypothetical protein
MIAVLHERPADKHRRLAELGLSEEILIQAVQRGFAEWAGCTLNHPPAFPGLMAWGETVRAIRELLTPLGWERSNEGNLPFTINQGGTIAIAVATGDDCTGNSDETPCTKSSKGPRTAGAVEANRRQLKLFPVEVQPQDLAKIKGNGGRMTWLLLLHRDENRRELRCELSRPTSMSENERVDGWIERIILRSTAFDGESTAVVPETNLLTAPVIDVPVKRRG